MKEWIDKAIVLMHRNKITNVMLASHLKVSEQYISEVLNGREVKKGKGSENGILSAIDEIITSKSITK